MTDVQHINIHKAKTHLSSLVELAAQGEPFVIAKAGKPMVTVIPYSPPRHKQRVGFLKGRVKVPDDFDRLGEEYIARSFEETL